MMKFLGLLMLVAVVGLVAYVGCGTRAEVAMDQITKRLDKALGELNIKRKEIEKKQGELQAQLAELSEKRVQGQVRLELLQEKKKNSDEALASVRSKVQQVAELVKEANASESKKITRNGKDYTAADLQAAAKEVADALQSEEAKSKANLAGYNALKSSVDFLVAQEKQAKDLMGKLASKISEIDAKKIAVDAVRENTILAGDNKSIGSGLEQLSKEIENLGIEVEAALRIETEKMDSLSSSNSVADELLSAPPADLDATQKMLEDLLKK
jgi:DNA repair exonuclease SbcCD ATPase subunit